MSNDVDGNEVVACNRGADGRLEPDGTFETGGTGSGTVEDSANGLIIANRSGESSSNNLQGTARCLYATSVGSDSISVFRVEPDGLELIDVKPSNGQRPTSVTVSKGVVYVMNSVRVHLIRTTRHDLERWGSSRPGRRRILRGRARRYAHAPEPEGTQGAVRHPLRRHHRRQPLRLHG